MRIVEIISTRAWGGREQYVLDFAEAMRARGHEVAVVLSAPAEVVRRYRAAGLEVVEAPMRKMLDCGITRRRIASLIPAEGETVLHVHTFRDATHALAARRGVANPAVAVAVSRHMVKRGGRSALDRRIYGGIDAAIFVSELARREFLSSSPPIDEDITSVVHNSIVLPTGKLSHEDKHDGKLRLMFHGRLSDEKGIDTFLEAMGMIGTDGAEIHIAGTGPADYEKHLRELAASLGIEKSVVWHGHVDNVHPLLATADIGVCPSRVREAFGLSMVEYMAHGVPVVTTVIGAQPEYITSWTDGVLVPPDDPQALADALRRLMADTSLRSRIGHEARRKFDTDLAYGPFIERMTEAFRQAIRHRTAKYFCV